MNHENVVAPPGYLLVRLRGGRVLHLTDESKARASMVYTICRVFVSTRHDHIGPDAKRGPCPKCFAEFT